MKEEKSQKHPVGMKYIHIGIAAIIMIIIMNLPAPESLEKGRQAMQLLGIIAGVVYLWVTEALPHAASGMLIIILVSILGINDFGAVFKNTFGSSVFAFLFGILALSAACKKSGLSKRIGAYFMLHSSTSANVLLMGTMIISFIISMFITDMAAVAIVIPIALAILAAMDAKPLQSNYAKCLMLGVSWGAVFGGICTPAGVGSNVTTMKLLSEMAGIDVTFTQWMKLCTPIGVIGLIVGFFILKLCFKPEIKNIDIDKPTLKKQLAEEKMNKSQKWVAFLFVVVVLAFLTSSKTGLNINWIAFSVIPLLLLPGFEVFKDWKEFQQSVNWGAIILAVAGVSLGTLANDVGLASWIANTVLSPLANFPGIAQIMSVALLTNLIGLFLSSMTITASVSVPIAIAFAQSSGAPLWAIAAAVCCASSVVIILVTQTPAIILSYAEGYFSIKDCAKAGIVMTVLSAIVIGIVIFVMGMPAMPV